MPEVASLNENCIRDVVKATRRLQANKKRSLIAVAGPPGVGKSTIAEGIVTALNKIAPESAVLVPMDGFHLDNDVISEAGFLDRKGSPPTFDFGGFKSILERLRDHDNDHYVPVFDRERDLSVAGARKVPSTTKIVVVEGNYLLLDQEPWNTLHSKFDYTLFIKAPLNELRERLIQRWLKNGYDKEGAIRRAEQNDIPNAELVISHQISADQQFEQVVPPSL